METKRRQCVTLVLHIGLLAFAVLAGLPARTAVGQTSSPAIPGLRTETLAVDAAVPLSAGPVKLPPKEKFHLFLLVGQSNMAGRGAIEEQDTTPHPRVFMLDQAGKWVPAVDPLHFDKPAAGTGLGKTFGIEIAQRHLDIAVGLIPCAVGGSPIDSWKPREFYEPTHSHPWDDAVRRARIAMKSGVLKGVLWHQGESDSNDALASTYELKLHDLISRFRKELRAPKVPFIVGRMGRFADRPWDQARRRVDKAHRDLPEKIPRTAFVDSEGLHHKGDEVHFDSASYRELGRRYAEAFAKLTGHKQPPEAAGPTSRPTDPVQRRQATLPSRPSE